MKKRDCLFAHLPKTESVFFQNKYARVSQTKKKNIPRGHKRGKVSKKNEMTAGALAKKRQKRKRMISRTLLSEKCHDERTVCL